MIKAMKKEKSYYQGEEIKTLCYSCTEKHVEIEIVATDKYNQKHTIGLCKDCKNELLKSLT